MKPTLVFGKERSRVPVDDETAPEELENIYYDVPLVPHTPLHIGLLVRVSSINYADGDAVGDTGRPACYTSEDTGVVGRITAIRTMERDTTELVVSNDNKESFTAFVYLTIHHEEGVTVRLALWLRALRALIRPFLPATRQVPLEREATLLHPRRNRRRAATEIEDENLDGLTA